MNLTDELERSIGHGPAAPPIEDLLVRGRRSLARRRAVTGTAAAGVAAAVLGTVLLAGGADPDAARPPVAGDPTSTASPSATTVTDPATTDPKPFPAQGPLRQRLISLAEYDGFGGLTIDPEATVRQRLDNPYGVASPGDSVALELDFRGYRMWFALVLRPDDSSTGTTKAWTDEQTFARFVQAQAGIADTSTTDGADVWPGVADLDAVRFDGDTEVLLPTNGATLLEQRPGIDVGSSFAGPDDQTAAAKVSTADGAVYYVLARRFGDKPAQYIAVAQAYGGPDLDDFLEIARGRYAEGGGGLL